MTDRSSGLALAAPLLTCLLALSASPTAADTPADGMALNPLPYPGQQCTATLSDGSFLAFDGVSVDHYADDGAWIRTLTSLPRFVWPSFMIVDPTESFLVVGESTYGSIARIDVASGGLSILTSLWFNYDAAFEDEQHVIVSAATSGVNNGLYRLDLTSGAASLLVILEGASGPVAVTSGGDLYYASVSDTFPAPPGASSVFRWTSSVLHGGRLLNEADAAVVAGGFDGAGDLLVDPATGEVYLAENNYGTGRNRILRLGTGPADSAVLVEGTPYQSINNLELDPGTGGSVFRPYQPSFGGTLRYNSTDFFSTYARNELVPRRPVADVSGQGTIGAGPFVLGVEAGPPGGFAVLAYGPSALYQSPEQVFALPGGHAPLFTGLDAATLMVAPYVLSLDGAGATAAPFFNASGSTGFLAGQALLFDSSLQAVGTSSAAFL